MVCILNMMLGINEQHDSSHIPYFKKNAKCTELCVVWIGAVAEYVPVYKSGSCFEWQSYKFVPSQTIRSTDY